MEQFRHGDIRKAVLSRV
ncbi:hypothetical protein MKD33_07050, partial [Chromobacterium piscinae]